MHFYYYNNYIMVSHCCPLHRLHAETFFVNNQPKRPERWDQGTMRNIQIYCFRVGLFCQFSRSTRDKDDQVRSQLDSVTFSVAYLAKYKIFGGSEEKTRGPQVTTYPIRLHV